MGSGGRVKETRVGTRRRTRKGGEEDASLVQYAGSAERSKYMQSTLYCAVKPTIAGNGVSLQRSMLSVGDHPEQSAKASQLMRLVGNGVLWQNLRWIRSHGQPAGQLCLILFSVVTIYFWSANQNLPLLWELEALSVCAQLEANIKRSGWFNPSGV